MITGSNIVLPPNQIVQLTNSDVTALRFQNIGPNTVFIKAAIGAVTPDFSGGYIAYPTYWGEDASSLLSQLFPGIPGANRVYALSPSGSVISVSTA